MSDNSSQYPDDGSAKNSVNDAGDNSALLKIKQELDHSCDALDAHTLSRLNSIRHEALERHERKSAKVRALFSPFGGFASACVLVLTVFAFTLVYYPAGNDPVLAPEANLVIEDMEILISTESLDFFEEYEFYQWLAENETSV